MILDPLALPPLLTDGLPGIGGHLKQTPDDFEVEEIPAYEPSGSGGFLYLWVEKRSMGAEYFQRYLARRLGIAPGEIGLAGLKDRHAVTRQQVSVPESVADRLDQIEGEGVRVLGVGRHSNKLRPGHLRGNHFRVRIRAVAPDAGPRLEALVSHLRHSGFPNFYGPQRFGRDGETARLGLALLSGERAPRDSAGRPVDHRNRFLRKFALSAAQSLLFNAYLARRMTDGLLHRVLAGDVMAKRPVGGLFVAEDLPTEQARFEAHETVPTGPMFGQKMFAAAGAAAEREAAVLADAGLTREAFTGFGKLLAGTRRPNLVYVDDLASTLEDGSAVLTFTLPAGCYATVMLREITKTTDLPADEAP